MLKKRFTAILMAALMLIGCVNTVTATESGYAYGDVDKSGTITSNDAATVLAYVLDPASVPDFDTELANVSSDKDAITDEDIISSEDAVYILQRVLYDIPFPCEPQTGDTTEYTTETTTQATTEETTETTTEEYT